MFFQTENASFKTAFTLEKSVAGLTEIYMNYDLFYDEGFKFVVSSPEGLLDYTITYENDKNYLSFALTD